MTTSVENIGMSKRSPEVDHYIAAAPAYARPILQKLRTLFHKAYPEIQETMKWGVPHFEHKGIVAGMAAFKEYIRFGFWKGKLLREKHNLTTSVGNMSMGDTRLTDISQLPPDKVLLTCIRDAVALNENGVKRTSERKAPKKPLETPDYFAAALRKKKLFDQFEARSPSYRRDYIEWLADAKQPETRERRLATALEWIGEGKSRNWKYERKK